MKAVFLAIAVKVHFAIAFILFINFYTRYPYCQISSTKAEYCFAVAFHSLLTQVNKIIGSRVTMQNLHYILLC